MANGRVVLRGRFRPGSLVSLVKVAGEHVLRSAGGELVAQKVVGEDGVVFEEGVEVGGRYFVTGRVDGELVDVRVRGNVPGQEPSHLVQPAIGPDPQKRADGSLEAAHGTPPVTLDPDAPLPADAPINALADAPVEEPVAVAPVAAAVTPVAADAAPVVLTDEEVVARAHELEIEGRSGMTVDQLRAAVAAADNAKDEG